MSAPDLLSRTPAFPHDPSACDGVEVRQTHLSIVFLTPERVCKFRKPVDLGFVDFTSRALRNADCLREIELNRRLTEGVYLGVAPLIQEGGDLAVGTFGEEFAAPDASGHVPEHCVVMRRLPDGGDALSLLEKGRLKAPHVESVARAVAHFHQRYRLVHPPGSAEWMERIRQPAQENFAVLAQAGASIISDSILRRASESADAFLTHHGERLEMRRKNGLGVDGHGDLHLQHVWFEEGRDAPQLIDCLEFREDFRCIDPAADIGFLAMDLIYRKRSRQAEHLLAVYADETDDFDLYRVVDFFIAYRAAVRAKVALLAAQDAALPASQRRGAEGSARRHLNLALRSLRPQPPAWVMLMCGGVGSGKSTLARVVANELGGVVVSSDRVRKHLAGIPSDARQSAAWGKGLYSPERTEQVYRALTERAEAVLSSGRVAVIDATFSRRKFRDSFYKWAAHRGIRVALMEARACKTEVLRRLTERAAQGVAASDAGPEHYDRSMRDFESPLEWPARLRRVIRSDEKGWRRKARFQARRLRDSARVPRC